MNKVSDYIFVMNAIPKDLCESLIDECNTKEWKKHTWYDYGRDQAGSMPEKELDVMACTQEQQNKITPHLIKALEAYQNKYSNSVVAIDIKNKKLHYILKNIHYIKIKNYNP